MQSNAPLYHRDTDVDTVTIEKYSECWYINAGIRGKDSCTSFSSAESLLRLLGYRRIGSSVSEEKQLAILHENETLLIENERLLRMVGEALAELVEVDQDHIAQVSSYESEIATRDLEIMRLKSMLYDFTQAYVNNAE